MRKVPVGRAGLMQGQPGERAQLKAEATATAELFAEMGEVIRRIAKMPDRTVPKVLARQRMPGLPTALYLRVSSDIQGKRYGPGSQRSDAEDACANYDLLHPHLTYEDHISASGQMVRTDFVRMLADARAKKFKVLLVGRVDRFARNEAQGWLYLYELILAGVWVYFCDEDVAAGLDNGWEDPVSAKLTAAAALLRLIRQNILKSVRRRRKDGVRVGKPPFGWRSTGTTLVPEPIEIAAVDRAVALLLENELKVGDIAVKLNSEGFSYRGKPFNKARLYDIYTNPVLIGTWRINRRDPEDYQELTNKNEPRIKQAEWDRMCQILRERGRARRPVGTKRPYVFRGLLRCGETDPATGLECGEVMACTGPAPRQGKRFPTYRHPHGKGCCASHPDRTWMVGELTLLNMLEPHFDGAVVPDAALEAIDRYITEYQKLGQVDYIAMRAGYEQDLNRFDLALRHGAYGRDPEVARAAWAKERAEVEQKLAGLPDTNAILNAEIAAQVLQLGEVWKKSNVSERHQLLSLLYAAIYVTKDGGSEFTRAGLVRRKGRRGISRLLARPEYALLLAYAFSNSEDGLSKQIPTTGTIESDRFLAWLRERGVA